MAARMAGLLVLIILLLSIIVHKDVTGQLHNKDSVNDTVVSGTNGTDQDSCFKRGVSSPCKTLSFVLDNFMGSCNIIGNLKCSIILLSNQSLANGTASLCLNFAKLNLSASISSSVDGISLSLTNWTFNCSYALHFSNISLVITGHLVIESFFLKFTDILFTNWSSITMFESFISMRKFSKVVIEKCAFLDIIFVTSGIYFDTTSNKTGSADSFSEVLILNCTFNENMLNYDTSILHFANCATGSLTIQDCMFRKNRVASYNHNNEAALIKGGCGNSSVDSVIFFNNTLQLLDVSKDEMNTMIFLSNLDIQLNKANRNLISLKFSATAILKNLVVKKNSIQFTYQSNFGSIISLQGQYTTSFVILLDSHFHDNSATALGIQDITTLYLYGNITFVSNNGLKGGGMYMGGSTNISGNANVSFLNNIAVYGGAVYSTGCLTIPNKLLHQLELSGNSAGDYNGPNLYIYNYNACMCHLPTNVITANDNSPLLVSYATAIEIYSSDGSDVLELYPGKEIILYMNVTDCHGQNVSCVADVLLICHNGSNLCIPTNEFLSGPSSLFIYSGVIDTGLQVKTHNETMLDNHQMTSTLMFVCRDSQPQSDQRIIDGMISLKLVNCPLGLKLINSTECKCPNINNQSFLCSEKLGLVCIEKGYWIGINNQDVLIHLCTSNLMYCKNTERISCPSQLTKLTSRYVSITLSKDGLIEQCINGHGGTLCMYCATSKTFTYFALRCIPNKLCKGWHPWFLLMVTLLLSFIIGSALIVAVRTRFEIGSGYLYGPLFYLATLSQVAPIHDVHLSLVVKVYTSLYLLRFEILGYAPLCFFSKLNPLYSIGLQFINPVIFLFVLILTIIFTKFCSHVFLKLQPNPVRSMSVLLIASFWSLARTSIEILHYTNMKSDDGNETSTVPLFHPDIGYFTNGHIPLVIVSVCVLIVLSLYPFLLVLSQFFNFHRLKPFIDEFQSCYQDRYRWYSAVYACSVISITPITISGFRSVACAIILSVTLAQCMLQPYRKKWLNIVDSLLLIDLTFVIFFENHDQNAEEFGTTVIIWLLIIIPLIYISLGTIVLLLHGTKAHLIFGRLLKWKPVKYMIIQSKVIAGNLGKRHDTVQYIPPQQQSSNKVTTIIDDDEREPLIAIHQ